MQITIAGSAVPVEHGSVRIVRAIGQRSQGGFAVYDQMGTLRFYEAQPVIITDNNGNIAFTGVVAQADRARPVQGPLLEHVISVADNHYYADKRLAPGSWVNVSAASIVNDILTNVLAQEGITAIRGVNLFSTNQSNIETDISGFYLGGAQGSGQGPYSSGGVTLARDTTYAWEGAHSLKCVTDGSAAYQAVEARINVASQFTAGATYTLSAYIYSATAGGTLRFYCQSSSGSIGTVNTITLATGWNRYTVTATLPNPLTQTWLALRWDTGGTAQALTFWVDALQFEQAASASTWEMANNGQPSIQTGPTIISLVSDYAPASDVFDAIVQKAGGGWYWTIDDSKVLWLQQQSSAPTAPYTIDDTLTERGTDVATHGNTQYRNTQYMLGGVSPTATQTETRIGDGNTTAFTWNYPLNSAPTLTLNGVAQTVGIQGVDTGKDWYWQLGSRVTSQDSSGTKLVSTDTLQNVYIGQYPAVAISSDSGAISTRQTREGGGTSGIVEAVAYDTTLTSTDQAQQGAAGYLSKYAHDLDTFQCLTKEYGFAEGQACVVNVPAHDFNNESMLIESVTITDSGPIGGEVVDLYYALKCVSGPTNIGWQAWYKQLATQAAQVIGAITLGQSQTVALLQSGTVALAWTVTGTTQVNSLLIPSATLYPSTTLYPGTAGTPVSLTWTKTNAGLNAIRDALSGAGSAPNITYFAWGTGTQATPATATQLAAEAGRKQVTSITDGSNVGEELINGYLGPQDAVGVAITEVAFFGGPSANGSADTGIMLLYALYSHTHTSSESIQIQADSTIA